MRILPFPISGKSKRDNSACDWTQQEIADFYRAHRLLVENGTNIGLDRGITDIGEPWMVFFDVGSQDVFLHIARIDNLCHLICEPLNLKLSAPTVASLITRFEDAVKSYLSIRTERSRNVVIHPAARIILSISAIFLLVKLDSGEAQAKDAVDKTVFGDPVSRLGADKSTSALARAHHAFARVFESVEAPHSAALLAGMILAGELALSSSRQSSAVSSQDPKILTSDAGDKALALVDTSSHGEEVSGVSSAVTVAMKTNAAEVDEPGMHNSAASSNSDDRVLTLETPVIPLTLHDVVSVKSPQPVTEPPLELAVFSPNTGNASDSQTQITSESIKALKDLIQMDAGSFIEEGATKTPIDVPANDITVISVSNLDQLYGKVGFVHHTSYDIDQMYQLVDYFKSVLGEFEFGYLGGKVLIEEIGLEVRSDQEIGLWTNVMADGSTFSVIGNVNLIDDVVTFFT